MGLSSFPVRFRAMSLTLAVCASALLTTNSQAQDKTPGRIGIGNEPVAVVTLGSINKLMQDVNYVTGLAGQPQAGGMFQMMAATFTQGINTELPIGVLLPMVDGAPEPIGVIPTSDITTVLDRLKAQIGPADKLDDGTLAIAVGVNTVFIRQQGDWAVAARSREVLDLAPKDPMLLFEGLGNSYDIAARLKLQQIPAEVRDMLVEQIKQGFEQALAQQQGGDDEARAMAEPSIKQIEQLLRDTEELSFGWNIDSAGKQIVFDFDFQAIPDSELGQMYSFMQPIPSQFASVIRPDAAAYFHSASSISPNAVEQARANFEQSFGAIRAMLSADGNLSESQIEDINQMVDRIADLALNSIAEGKSDTGGVLVANEKEIRFVFGSFLSDGNEAKEIIQDLAKKVEGAGDAPEFKFDVGTYKGVTMHVIEAEVPADEDEVRRIFGDTLKVHLGTADKAVYMAIGDDCEAELKKLIDAGNSDTGGDRPLMQMNFTLLPVLKYAQSIEENDIVGKLITVLGSANDPGLIRIVSQSNGSGTKTRVSMGEGLMQAIGAGIEAQQQAQFQQF